MRVLMTSAGCVARVAAIADTVPAAKLTPVLERPSYIIQKAQQLIPYKVNGLTELSEHGRYIANFGE